MSTEKRKKTSNIIIIILLLQMFILAFVIAKVNVIKSSDISNIINQTNCLDIQEANPILISRVPINDKREELREYYYNETWWTKCKK